ncbi:flagellar motor protein MotB [Silvibacterium dinghuense]|uniref:Flagellar motor protein MotB n=1 Tax=Silvibacterium dinghuense TaxID=1560006 RepID=A0A4Q1SHI7_9BACT|nr:flagellar motor protein MotB [Silvibacterium dinghuense]RXS96849.1 flagellar motor protein MotB [Silvibacterium dinghuense]GGG94148.1 flagellar motor protein MotB [Silvibacterium dinghuense]
MSRKTIIIIKKVKRHGEHHGGAWKVAYADFVTAMMSLFIVLWLMNTSAHVRKAVAGYFNDPLGRYHDNGSDKAGEDANPPAPEDAAKQKIEQLKQQLQKSITSSLDLNPLQKQIQMQITPEGLRIELLESRNGTFFDSGSAELNANGKEVLAMLAKQLGAVPNQISIEGHTDSQPYAGKSDYTNWELSADRANAARRLMQESGLKGNQVSQVRGYADQRLRVPADPLDPSNRRISVIVQYLSGSNSASSLLQGLKLPQGMSASPIANGGNTDAYPANAAAPAGASTPAPAAPAPAVPAKSSPATPAQPQGKKGLVGGLLSKIHH